MAQPLDLQEQEQLDQIKHFWKTWGNLITSVLLVAALAFAGWNGWQYYQRNQAAQAAALYDTLERSVEAGDPAIVERTLGEMKDRFGSTPYAQQAGLLAAKALHDKGNAEASRAALTWVAEKAVDPGYQAVARLRLAAELLDSKSYDDALKQLAGTFPKEYEALAADRKGDIYMAQGKRDEARAEYQKAWTALEPRNDYRRMVEIKLNAVGVDPQSLKPAASKQS
ncbi:tetratricopeptide repeat protein [Variovorax rhizosphaerae]|uniref:Ancillary SecYEG translocon subunit n=1 Tax=Variovorax rhizosphaerae TaxID=1836200 RepID=A0ABU8WX58_9BURK